MEIGAGPGPGPEAFVRIENLRKRYTLGTEVVNALAGVDLAIARGEAVAILGPSGSGKSTLLHLIGALDTPSTGRVLVAGCDLAALDETGRARYRNERVGFVFQAFFLQPHLTARENVELPLKIAGVAPRERALKASSCLEQVGLSHRASHRPAELSGGERQRVSIARALANEPAILLADEPTGNLDSRTGSEIIDLFIRLNRERGVTLVVVTHDEALARRIGRTVRIRDGAITADERPPDGSGAGTP